MFGALIIIVGDFKQLNDPRVLAATGLLSLVTQPTRCTTSLDRIYASEDCYSTAHVLASVVRTDHYAIVAVPSGPINPRVKTRWRTCMNARRRPPQQHVAHLRHVDLDWNAETSDAQQAYIGQFLC